jgi:SAM-dependent methyltransferase
MLLGGELYNAPIQSPQNILDLGTGTGIWALDIAEYVTRSPSSLILHPCMPARLTPDYRKSPGAHVIGNDISPIQPGWVAPNIEFIVEDFEGPWEYESNYFDFIHARCLAGCVSIHLPIPTRVSLTHEADV